jgi:hypothetical protein
LLDGSCRDAQRTPSRGRLDRLEVQPVDRARPYEGGGLGDDFRGEGFFEAPFLTPASVAGPAASFASQMPSLTSTSSWVSRRKRRYSAICSCVCATALGGMILVTVLPPRRRVNDQLGP